MLFPLDYGNAKAMMFAPDAIATYCRPATMYVIGDALKMLPAPKCHNVFPFFASTAANAPLLSP